MTSTSDSNPAEGSSALRRYVPLLVYAIVLLVLLVIPLKIISYGYLPIYDDPLSDAARAVSGKEWQEILVLRSDYVMDPHAGWHTLLRQIHLRTHCTTEGLVLTAVVMLFTLLGWSAVPWLKRPEAWLVTLILVAGVGPAALSRFTLGRPFMISGAALITILLLRHAYGSRPPDWRAGITLSLLITVAVWLHGVWYLWALPVIAFFLARQYRWGTLLIASWIAGAILGAILTGHPITYLTEALRLPFDALGSHVAQRSLATELRPTPGNLFPLLLMGGLLAVRQLAKLDTRPLNTDPAFWLGCLGWVLGYRASRFWEDWGVPAMMVLLTIDIQALIQQRLAFDSLKRLALTAGLALTLYLSTTGDTEDRWTYNLTTQYLTEGDPELAGWLPDKGGIFYDVDMFFFYQTFFKNPKADWRYMVGYEPILMPDEDLVTYQNILWSGRDPKAYQPWVDKLRPEDRIAIRPGNIPPPQVFRLEWTFARGLWLGRLPRTQTAPAAPANPAAVQPR